VHIALLTGNFERAAQLKLEHFDLWRYFRAGSFGDEETDRNLLLPEALRRIAAAGHGTFAADAVVVIGDTPHDVAVARGGGARSIAVATGSHTTEQLRAAGADHVFHDLSQLREVLGALNLSVDGDRRP
jgi:phosphoglycolate phosphatase-like HAD superfamily hydrolase